MATRQTDDAQLVPDPPWRRQRRPARTRAPITQDAIVDAAIKVLNEVGLDGFSMRRVSEELGTGAASLYWHVLNKEELLDLVFERILGGMHIELPNGTSWTEQFAAILFQWRTVTLQHTDLARLAFGRHSTGPRYLAMMEWSMGLFRSAGIPDDVAAIAGEMIHSLMNAVIAEEALGLTIGGEQKTLAEADELIRGYYASVPEEQFPNLHALSDRLTLDPDKRYAFAVDLLTRGLATYCEKPASKPRTRKR